MAIATVIPAAKEAPPHRLTDYLESLLTSGDAAAPIVAFASRVWASLRAVDGKTQTAPDAAPGSDGEILFTWNRAERHLELEIFPDGIAERFYRNRSNGELAGDALRQPG